MSSKHESITFVRAHNLLFYLPSHIWFCSTNEGRAMQLVALQLKICICTTPSYLDCVCIPTHCTRGRMHQTVLG